MSNYPSVPTRTSVLPDCTALSRYLMTLGESRGDTHKALMVAERWRDTPQLKATLARYQAAVIESRMERPDGSGLDAIDVARERTAITALAATLGERLRADYLGED